MSWQDKVVVVNGDALHLLAELPDNSIDAIVTDPPYGIGFMGKEWDSGKSFVERKPAKRNTFDHVGGNHNPTDSADAARTRRVESQRFGQWCERWAAECLRVLKPGGHMLAFGGSRTWHRLASAIEDAGFEIRDSIAWIYGSGFPKSLDVSKAIDKAAGAEREVIGTKGNKGRRAAEGWGMRQDADGDPVTAPATDAAKQWQGWGTALKPAHEPIVVARKPLQGTVAANVLEHGTGALNIDATRIATTDKLGGGANTAMTRDTRQDGWARPWMDDHATRDAAAARSRQNTARAESLGRWPTNVLLDEHAAAELDEQSGIQKSGVAVQRHGGGQKIFGGIAEGQNTLGARADVGYGDTGGASRFFPVFKYQAKAPKKERPTYTTDDGKKIAHPTVKPLELLRWLVKLVTPPGGTVLDPFAGSGTTGEAAYLEGFNAILIERESDYLPLIEARMAKHDPETEATA